MRQHGAWLTRPSIGFSSPFILQFLFHCLALPALVGFGFAGVIHHLDRLASDGEDTLIQVRSEGIISNALGFMNRLSLLFYQLGFPPFYFVRF